MRARKNHAWTDQKSIDGKSGWTLLVVDQHNYAVVRREKGKIKNGIA